MSSTEVAFEDPERRCVVTVLDGAWTMADNVGPLLLASVLAVEVVVTILVKGVAFVATEVVPDDVAVSFGGIEEFDVNDDVGVLLLASTNGDFEEDDDVNSERICSYDNT